MSIKIGWSEINLTPDKKISLAGQFYERISEYVETPITATALAIESDGEQMIICSCDLVRIGKNLVKRVRKELEDTDIPLDKIIINATHVHTAFVYELERNAGGSAASSSKILEKYLPNDMQYKSIVSSDDVMTPQESLLFLVDKISTVIKDAWDSRKEAMYSCGFGRVAVGMCRRVCFSDSSAKMWGDTNDADFTELEGGNDNGIELMFTFDTSKKLTGIVANVACPAQVLEHRSFISSDYWGKVKMQIREKYGDDIFMLCLCSAAGDQAPRDLIRWQNPETPINDPNIVRNDYIERRSDGSMFDIQGTYKIGRRIANEIFAAYEEIEEYNTDAVLKHKTEILNLPLRRVTPKEIVDAEKAIKDFVRDNKGRNIDYNDSAALHVYGGTLARAEYQHTHNVVPIEVHFIRFGDIAFATNPFELFLDFGNQMRARIRAKQTFLIQLACDSHEYLPTKKAEKGSHYSAYVSSGDVGHEGGDILVRETVEVINSFFD